MVVSCNAWCASAPSSKPWASQGLPSDTVKHLEEKLWELRIRGKDGIARAIYVTAFEQRVVIVRVFIKKTQKTPRHELELARQRAKEVG